jgi:hypothetical protein
MLPLQLPLPVVMKVVKVVVAVVKLKGLANLVWSWTGGGLF